MPAPPHILSRLLPASLTALTAMACTLSGLSGGTTATMAPPSPPTPLPQAPVQPGAANPDEPVAVIGTIPFTSPFFINTISEPFVLLEDEAGFVHRDREFAFPLNGQVMGPVEIIDDQTLRFELSLPGVPQGAFVDVDQNGQSDVGVQVFAVAYWSNTWGGPFLEKRDGTGWSNAYTSTVTDPDRQDEIMGGLLVVWAPDSGQAFPSDFGPDGELFTSDDPVAPIPAGYNFVDLDQTPFRVFKQARLEVELKEGVSAVHDLSGLGYSEAFKAMFDQASLEYPFTEEKHIDWAALYQEFAPQVASATDDAGFYRALRDFTYAIPDGHVGGVFDNVVFNQEQGGGFGLVLAQLGDGRVIVTQILPGLPGEKAGIDVGAEMVTWEGQPAAQAVANVVPYFGPFSSKQALHQQQLAFLARTEPGARVRVTYRNPGSANEQPADMTAAHELDSLFESLSILQSSAVDLPIEARILPESGLAYVVIRTFSGDYNLMARLWEHLISALHDDNVPGLIIDLRYNGGGSEGLALDFAGYFFDEDIVLSTTSYYNRRTGQFEPQGLPTRITPAPSLFDGPLAVLVSPDCVSACEGFAYALNQGGRSTVVGHAPTAGAFGEVGRGQYGLPGGFSLQFPTGRPETPDGKVLIEGEGVVPDVIVPVTVDSALGRSDAVLDAAVKALLAKIGS
ncbi:MAG TPA: S41 family peptidase [Anaerolineales bacterium]|nr:S41 family peptidase [Anaerolineales bacterium]